MLREDSRTGQGGLTPASYQLRASEQAGNGLPRASLHAYTIEEEKRAIPFCLREADRGLACQTEFAASVFVLETKAPIPGCDVSEVGIRGERQWTWLRRCISWSVLQALTSWPRASSCPSLSSQQEDSPACTDMSGCMYWELVQCDSHALAAQQGAVLDSVVLVQQSREPFAARSSDSAQRPQIGGPGAARVHARWSWSSLALSRWLGGWGFAVGGMLAGVVFGAVGLAVGTCVAVRLLRASGRVPSCRIKSLARTRQSTRRRGRCHRQSLLSRGGVHPPDTGFSGC